MKKGTRGKEAEEKEEEEEVDAQRKKGRWAIAGDEGSKCLQEGESERMGVVVNDRKRDEKKVKGIPILIFLFFMSADGCVCLCADGGIDNC